MISSAEVGPCRSMARAAPACSSRRTACNRVRFPTPDTGRTRPVGDSRARSSSLDGAHPARPDRGAYERAGCARSNEDDPAHALVGPGRSLASLLDSPNRMQPRQISNAGHRLDPPGWTQPCPIILIGPRASCALMIGAYERAGCARSNEGDPAYALVGPRRSLASLLDSPNRMQTRQISNAGHRPDLPGWRQPCPIMFIGPRASCALVIEARMSAQDARGPMRMTRRTLSSVRGGASPACSSRRTACKRVRFPTPDTGRTCPVGCSRARSCSLDRAHPARSES